MTEAERSYDRNKIAKCLFNTAMVSHAQWDDMSDQNKEDWRLKADKWIREVNALKEQGVRFKAGDAGCGRTVIEPWRE